MSSLFERAEAALAQGRLDQAEALCLDLLAAEPYRPEAHRLLGQVQIQRRQLPEAIASYEHARELAPAIADFSFLMDLGALLHAVGRKRQAAREYQAAAEADPKSLMALYNVGAIALELSDEAVAKAFFLKVLELDSQNMKARHNLGQAHFNLGEIDEALACYMESAKLGAGFQAESMLALGSPMSPSITDSIIRQIRWTWARRFMPRVPRDKTFPQRRAVGLLDLDGQPLVDVRRRKLKIGYVSSYFHDRNWMKPVWGLINRHDRRQFAVALFSHAPEAPVTSGYQPADDDELYHIQDLSNEELAKRIEAAEVDILVDLNAYSEVPRLAVYQHKPAPVVVAWFNMFATSGLPGIDYLVGDDVVIRPAEEPHYVEKIKRLPGTYLAFEVFGEVPEVSEQPCLATDQPWTFGSLCSLYKITPVVIDLWSRILQQVPDSQLLIRNVGLGSEANAEYFRQRFTDCGVDPERLLLEGPTNHYDYLATYGRIDLALDTFPYTGGTTTSEALWQGVPLVTRTGDRWLPRISESLLRAAGLEEFVATTDDDYVEIAVRMSQQPDHLARLRTSMRQRLTSSAACDCEGLARAMEELYRTMWHEWLDKMEARTA